MTSTASPDGLPAAVEPLSVPLRPPLVAVVFEPGPDRVLARVRGEIDMDDAKSVHRDLTVALESSRDGLDIDMSAVTFCDSSGLDVLLDLNRMALEAGKSIVVTAPSRPVDRVLRLTGADGVLTVRGRPAPKASPPGTGLNLP